MLSANVITIDNIAYKITGGSSSDANVKISSNMLSNPGTSMGIAGFNTAAVDGTYYPAIQIFDDPNNGLHTHTCYDGTTISDYKYWLRLPEKEGTLACLDDIITSYNDLTDKPTIPDTTNFVTTNTSQTITGVKTFSGTGNMLRFKNTGSAAGTGIMFQNNSNANIGFFEFRTDDKVLKFGVNTNQGAGYKVGFQSFGNRTYTAYLPDNADKYTAIGAGDVYLPLSVNGNTASTGGDITLSATSTVTPTTTQLVFTYTDDTTETITLMTGASVTTTLS